MYPRENRRAACLGENLPHKGVSPARALPVSALCYVLLLLLFLTFSALVANPKNDFNYTVGNPARGLLDRYKQAFLPYILIL